MTRKKLDEHQQFEAIRRYVHPTELGAWEKSRLGASAQGSEEVEDAWIEARFGDDWIAAFRVVPDVDGAPVIGEVRVFPYEPGRPRRWMGRWSAEVLGYTARAPRRGLTARQLRQLPIGRRGEFLQQMIAIHRRERDSFRATYPADDRLPEWLSEGAGGWLAGALDRPRYQAKVHSRGRKPVADFELARLALLYVKYGTHAAVAKRMGFSLPKVKHWVGLARKRHILAAAPTAGDKGLLALTSTGIAILRERRSRRSSR